MISQERFGLTVNHRQPDKMMVDFGATPVTGIHVMSIDNIIAVVDAVKEFNGEN